VVPAWGGTGYLLPVFPYDMELWAFQTLAKWNSHFAVLLGNATTVVCQGKIERNRNAK